MPGHGLPPVLLRGLRLQSKLGLQSHFSTSTPQAPFRLRLIAGQSQSIASRQSQKRFYSDPPPPPPKKTKRSTLRALVVWTWRVTYISTIAGMAYVSYGIYQSKRPADQLPPDPSKKTLVVLGLLLLDPQPLDSHTSQAPDGAPSRCSKTSTPKTTMS
jgi:hypothetical protein